MSLEKQIYIENRFLSVFNDKAFKEILSKEDYHKYINAKQTQVFQKGESLFEEGQEVEGVFFIESGTAKLFKVGFTKKEQILRFIKEGDIVGYRSLLVGEPYQATAEAMSDLQAIFIPSEVFLNLLEVDSQLSYAMLQKICFELGESSNTVTFLAQKTVRERLAEVLLMLEQKLGTDAEGFIKIALTREDIANLIGTATESAIRLISEFKQDQYIEVEGRNIRVVNHEKLRKLGHVSLK